MSIGLTNMLNTGTAGIGVLVAGFLKRNFELGGVFARVGVILAIDGALLFAGYFRFHLQRGKRSGPSSDPRRSHPAVARGTQNASKFLVDSVIVD